MDNTQPGDVLVEAIDAVESLEKPQRLTARVRVRQWLNSNRTLLSNTASLIGTMVATSGLGFVYWWLAARIFEQSEVGYASGAIAIMNLIATVGILGLGSLLVGELAVNPKKGGSFISATLWTTGAVCVVISMIFLVLVPVLSPELESFLDPLLMKIMFMLVVVMTTWSNLMDQAVIGLLIGKLQLWRNVLHSVLKLSVVLGIIGGVLLMFQAEFIYGTWVIGLTISMFMVWWMLGKRDINSFAAPDWAFMRRSVRTATGHHILNLLLKAPSLIMPIIILNILGPSSNASFGIAWQIAAFTFILPGSVTTVLYAVGAADTSILGQKTRVTVAASIAVGFVTIAAMFITAAWILGLFKEGYLEAVPSLQLMAIGIFPITIREHYVAICRIYKNFTEASIIMAISDVIQIAAIIVGAHINGLTGLTAGWLIAVCIEGIITTPTLYRVMTNTYNRKAPPPKVKISPNSAS
jgi:O-antigen/teichoic acid export membrane protein